MSKNNNPPTISQNDIPVNSKSKHIALRLTLDAERANLPVSRRLANPLANSPAFAYSSR
jgi:hypothetical protein